MIITKINSTTNTNRFIRNNRKTEEGQTVPQMRQQPTSDIVSFKGLIVHGINSKREWKYYGDIFKPLADLSGRELEKAKAEFVKLLNANLKGTDFSKSVFHYGDFTNADLTNASFEDCTIDAARFIDVITDHTIFDKSYLQGTVFSGDFGPWTSLQKANLRGADMRDANVENINFKNSIYDEYSRFPAGFDPESKGMIFFKEDGMDFTKEGNWERMKLRYATYNDANFKNVNLKRVDMKQCRFNNCDFQRSNMTRVFSKNSEIFQTIFDRSELKQINLDKALLEKVSMKYCNLRGAILTWKDAIDLDLRSSIYDQYTLFNEGFDPEAHGMIYKHSSPAYYGIK